jgi:lipid A 3-O-deacylase
MLATAQWWGARVTGAHGRRSAAARTLATILVAAALWGGAASAQTTPSRAAAPKAIPAQATITAPASNAAAVPSDDPSFLSFGGGGFDVLHNYTAGEFTGEYRFGQKLWIFKPFLGLMGTTDRAFYGYGGFLVDIYLGNRWVLMPNAAFGYYDKGNGKDLGAHPEFRTGAEFAYRFDDRSRLGFSFHHISNAGISKKNPGEEEMTLVFSLPFNLLK